MDTGNRFERDPRSGTQQSQQAQRDDTGAISGQWSNPASGQGQGEERLDNTESGDQYAQQTRYGQAGGTTGRQRSDDWGQGRAGAGTTLDPSSTSAQYGGSESTARGQTGEYRDPTTGGNWQGERDDDETGTAGGRPTVTSKVKGTAEKMVGKVTGDPGRQARGEERKEGSY